MHRLYPVIQFTFTQLRVLTETLQCGFFSNIYVSTPCGPLI